MVSEILPVVYTVNGNDKSPLYIVVSVALLVVLVASVLLAITIGSVQIAVKDVYSVIFYKIFQPEQLVEYARGPIHDIVWLIRLPRIALAVAVGSGLAACGVIMQAIVKNPLADPYILGISSGASLGATLAIMLGVGVLFGTNYVGVVAFMGALAVAILVLMVANVGSRANSIKLLLAGLAVSAACSSFSSFIIFFANDREGMQNITYWLMGSLAAAKWTSNAVIYVIVISGIAFFMTQYRTLNLMLLGDEVSITLGSNLHQYRQVYLLVTSLMIGFIVYSSGIIGFIGLVIPHFVRMFFGTDHKKILPLVSLAGAIFLVWADVFARVIIPKTELPIGIVVSMIGAPCFIYMLMKRSYGFGGKS